MSSYNKLKSISVETLESAIAKAIGELTGIKYDCFISDISYGVPEKAKFDVSLDKHMDIFNDQHSYYVYENWRAEGHKATIHFSNCRFCNEGKGVHPGASEEHGQWHGPFETFQQAVAAAQDTGGLVRECQHCKPQ